MGTLCARATCKHTYVHRRLDVNVYVLETVSSLLCNYYYYYCCCCYCYCYCCCYYCCCYYYYYYVCYFHSRTLTGISNTCASLLTNDLACNYKSVYNPLMQHFRISQHLDINHRLKNIFIYRERKCKRPRGLFSVAKLWPVSDPPRSQKRKLWRIINASL